MKKFLIALSCVFLLAACDCDKAKKNAQHNAVPPAEKSCEELHPPMSNEDIVRDTKYCESNGLDAEAYSCDGKGVTTRIACKPRNRDKE